MPQISQSSLISYVPAVASPRLVVVSVVSSLQHLRSTVLRTMTSCFTSGSSSKMKPGQIARQSVTAFAFRAHVCLLESSIDRNLTSVASRAWQDSRPPTTSGDLQPSSASHGGLATR